ncbi:nucleolar complex protein 3 [Achlya hypogyna]|uniref:Nucleolar complex protein 3 n=1 Tax=Achlya hypogyna TaxID=1202772 RepID=A0A1V9YPX7_ACHHY|nr:nucleolar complex protein 3 [Achlya hypogyna]
MGNNKKGAAKSSGSKRKAPVNNKDPGLKKAKKDVKPAAKKKKGGAAKKPAALSAPVDEDVEIDDEDIEFFESHGQFSSFLNSMDREALQYIMIKACSDALTRSLSYRQSTKKTKQKPMTTPAGKTLEEIEAAPRSMPVTEKAPIDISTKLPVKSIDGAVKPNKLMQEIVQEAHEAKVKAEEEAAEEDEDEDDDEQDIEEEADLGSDVSDLECEEITDVAAPVEKPVKAISPEELKALQVRRLAAKKEEMAVLCEAILESPEDGLKKSKEHPENLSKFQQLHAMCEDTDLTLCKLAMLSELSVLLDILPDYRIRIGGDSDGPQKKKVKEMKEFEASMLNQYQTFLKFLSATATSRLAKLNPNQQTRTPGQVVAFELAETAVKCLAELLKVKFAFNFNLNLIVAMIPFSDSAFLTIQRPTCEAFEVVFKADKTGVAALEIVRQMSNYVKKRNHRVTERMIRTLLAMPLDVTMEAGEIARKVAKSSRKKRRRQQQEGDTIATGLKEAEAVVDKSERDKTQADILHELVLIYFRILKNSTYSPAMPAVLEGLTKFAYLINLEIMIDLMKVLKTLLREDILPLQSAFHAVLTGIKTLQGPGAELKVDDKEFVDVLYKLLLRFVEGENVASFPAALQCVEAVFVRRKEIMVDRVAAFVKRLALISTCLPPHQVLAVSALVRSLFHRYNKLHQLLENDQDRVASGVYRADVNDPDFSNPFAAACWELALLAQHYHPVVASFSLGTADLAPSLPNEYPKALLERYDTQSTGEFAPRIAVPKPNPLFNKISRHQKQKKSKPVFITPSYRRQSAFLTACLELDEAENTL